MALHHSKYSELPDGAVMLSEEDALKYQMKIIKNWKKPGDTWIFKYGAATLTTACALSNMYINGYYRRRFRLMSYGRLSSYLPLVVLPASLTYALHMEKVIPDILLQKECPTCLQLRAAAFQSLLGTVFPAVLAPLGSVAFAIQYGTYNMPNITSDPKKVYNIYRNFTKPIGPLLVGIFVAHAAAATFITYLEGKAVTRINNKLDELEYELLQSNVLPS